MFEGNWYPWTAMDSNEYFETWQQLMQNGVFREFKIGDDDFSECMALCYGIEYQNEKYDCTAIIAKQVDSETWQCLAIVDKPESTTTTANPDNTTFAFNAPYWNRKGRRKLLKYVLKNLHQLNTINKAWFALKPIVSYSSIH